MNRPPILSKIPNQTIKESQILSKINMNDESKLILDIKLARPQNPKKNEDEDIDLQKLKYSCSVKVGTSSIYSKCSESIRNFTLNENNGEIEWRTDYFQANVYDFKVSVTDNDPSNPLSDTENFIVNVLNVNVHPN